MAGGVPDPQRLFVGRVEAGPHPVVAAVVEGEARDDDVVAVREEQVHRREGGDAEALPHPREHAQRLLHAEGDVLRGEVPVGVGELGEQERVDPLAVGGAAHRAGEVRLDVGEQGELHLLEAGELPVVRQRQARAVEEEGVEVLRADHRAGVVRHPAQVGQGARRLHLAGERPQVAVEDGELGGAMDEGDRRLLGPLVPGEEAAARQVEPVQQRRLVRLVREGDVGLVEQVLEQDRLTEIGEDAAHGGRPLSPGGPPGASRGWSPPPSRTGVRGLLYAAPREGDARSGPRASPSTMR